MTIWWNTYAIIDTNLETNDTGGIEPLGRDRQDSGNIIRYNLIRNVVGLKTSPKNKIGPNGYE
jgi:hypothetical protein